MPKIRVGCLQMPVERGAVEKNLECVENALSALRPGAVDLICLPEMWSTDFSPKNTKTLARQTGHAQRRLGELARQLNCWITGSALGQDPKRGGIYYNEIALLSPHPQPQNLPYRKIHLFSPLREERQFQAGEQLRLPRIARAKMGLSICYDLRFPELYRALAAAGAQVILVPSAWPEARREHWQTLLKARAIENQVFVVGVNRSGNSARGFRFAGCSMVVDPWGEVLWQAPESQAAFAIIEIDLLRIPEVRRQITVWKDRRPQLYCRWQNREKALSRRRQKT